MHCFVSTYLNKASGLIEALIEFEGPFFFFLVEDVDRGRDEKHKGGYVF